MPLDGRPEAEQLDALLAAAEEELKAQRYGCSSRASSLATAPASSAAPRARRSRTPSIVTIWRCSSTGSSTRSASATERRSTRAKRALREIGLQRDKLHDAIVAEVRAAYASTQSRRGQLPLADAAVERAAQAYELQRDRIYDKQGLPLEALQAMQALATAELARIDALVGYDLAQIRLHTALGNPLEIGR